VRCWDDHHGALTRSHDGTPRTDRRPVLTPAGGYTQAMSLIGILGLILIVILILALIGYV
jgi:hypothetical protein